MSDLMWGYPGDSNVQFALNVIVQITLIVGVAFLASKCFLRWRPTIRHTLWKWVLLSVALMPLILLVLHQRNVIIFELPVRSTATENAVRQFPNKPSPIVEERGPAVSSNEDARIALSEVGTEAGPLVPAGPVIDSDSVADLDIKTAVADTFTVESLTTEQTKSPPQMDWLRGGIAVLVWIWLGGVVILLFRFLHGLSVVRTIRRQALPSHFDETTEAVLEDLRLELQLSALPQIVTSSRVGGPVTLGFWRTVIALPPKMIDRLSACQFRDVVLHECGHILGRDSFVALLSRSVTMILWPHPLIHLMNRELARGSEEVCDNHVLAHVEPRNYVQTLLDIALMIRDQSTPIGAVGMFSQNWQLEDRIRDLLDTRRQLAIRPNRWVRGTILLMLAVGVFVIAGTRLVFADSALDSSSAHTALKANAPAGTAVSEEQRGKDDQGNEVANKLSNQGVNINESAGSSSPSDNLNEPFEQWMVPGVDEIERGQQAKLPNSRWQLAMKSVRNGIANQFLTLTLKEDRRSAAGPHQSHIFRYQQGNNGLDISLVRYNTPRQAGEALRVTDRHVSVKSVSLRPSPGEEFRLRDVGDEAYRYFPGGSVILCYSNVFVVINGQPVDLKSRIAKVIAAALENSAQENQPDEVNPPVKAGDKKRESLLSSSYVPPIDKVKHDPIPKFTPDPSGQSKRDQYRLMLKAFEQGLAKELPKFTLEKTYLSPRPQFSRYDAFDYIYRHGNESVFINLMFFRTPKEAAERLRSTAEQLANANGMTALKGLGDEAYQYGIAGDGSLLMCDSNVYVVINGTSRDLKGKMARVIADGLTQVAIRRAFHSQVKDVIEKIDSKKRSFVGPFRDFVKSPKLEKLAVTRSTLPQMFKRVEASLHVPGEKGKFIIHGKMTDLEQ